MIGVTFSGRDCAVRRTKSRNSLFGAVGRTKMLPVSSRSVLGGVRTILLIVLALGAVPGSWPQNGSEGTVTVSVVDPSGSVVQGAQLELRDVATNDLRKAETQ